MDTKVLIIGGGPSGLLLSLLLTKNDIDNIILEKNTALHVANRIRAGILEPGTVKILKKAGLGKRLSKEGITHSGFNISFNDQIYHINMKELANDTVTVYGQTEVTKDLMDKGALAKLDINVLLMKYNDELCKAMNGQKYNDEVDFIVKYEPRNRFISNLALDQKGNTLILFQFVEKHGKPLHSMISERADKDRKVFYVSGETGVDAREEVRNITEQEKNAIIVASMGVFSTGINIRNLHNIIFASPSKSQIRILQSIGRGLRKSDDGRSTTLYDISDDITGKNFSLLHSIERLKIYKNEKFEYKTYKVDLHD